MRNQKPWWWLLYAIVLLMFAALLWNVWYGARGIVGDMLDGAIVLGGFGLIIVWLKSNQAALWEDDWARREMRSESGNAKRTQAFRSRSVVKPRVTLHEPQPRTGFGSARGKWYRVRVHERVARDIVRISHLQIEE